MNLLTVLEFLRLAPRPAQDVRRLDDTQLRQLEEELHHKLAECQEELRRRGPIAEYVRLLDEMEACPF